MAKDTFGTEAIARLELYSVSRTLASLEPNPGLCLQHLINVPW